MQLWWQTKVHLCSPNKTSRHRYSHKLCGLKAPLRGVHIPQQSAADVRWRQLSIERCNLRRRESEHRAAKGAPQCERQQRERADEARSVVHAAAKSATRSFTTYAIAGSTVTLTELRPQLSLFRDHMRLYTTAVYTTEQVPAWQAA